LEQSVPEGLHTTEWTYVGAVREGLQTMVRRHVGEVPGELSPMGEIPHWSRGIV